MSQRYFEFIEDAKDEIDAMRRFIGRFTDEDDLHEYIFDHRLQGLSYVSDEGLIDKPFIDMGPEAWSAPYRRQGPRPGR